MKIATSRPRVYLIDFEVAVEFPPDCPTDQCVSIGLPIGGSVPQPEMYSRPCPPELRSGKPYCPFKLDVWQLGRSLWDFSASLYLHHLAVSHRSLVVHCRARSLPLTRSWRE